MSCFFFFLTKYLLYHQYNERKMFNFKVFCNTPATTIAVKKKKNPVRLKNLNLVGRPCNRICIIRTSPVACLLPSFHSIAAASISHFDIRHLRECRMLVSAAAFCCPFLQPIRHYRMQESRQKCEYTTNCIPVFFFLYALSGSL